MRNPVTEKQITQYVKKYYKDCIWLWTTVDNHGYPQILLYEYDLKTKKYIKWLLLSQEEIAYGISKK